MVLKKWQKNSMSNFIFIFTTALVSLRNFKFNTSVKIYERETFLIQKKLSLNDSPAFGVVSKSCQLTWCGYFVAFLGLP